MEKNKVLRISEAARSVFYIPLLATVGGGFLEKEGYQGILGTEPGKGAERLKQLEQGVLYRWSGFSPSVQVERS
jgi:heme oxygenase